jgi:hypothetical protein
LLNWFWCSLAFTRRSGSNSYQQHWQDAERRDQILASLEQQLREGIESGKTNRANQERRAAEFHRALDAGEMPPLQPFVFITDYSPSDWATILQSGGAQLLDVQTLIAVRCSTSLNMTPPFKR